MEAIPGDTLRIIDANLNRTGEGLRFLPFPASMTAAVAHVQSMLFGLVLVVLMLRRPQGIIPESRLVQET